MDFQTGGFDDSEPRDSVVPLHRERRTAPRHAGLVDHAVLTFRSALHIVPVVNISSRGAMIESALDPHLGESVIIRFAGCSPIHAFARWSREGRIGLNFGCEMIIGGD